MDDIATARSNAQSTTESAAKLQESIPGLLQGLRQNLVSIYQKDNPLVQGRTQALESYLSAPDQARASYLPANQPQVEGSPLNFSPTQLQAMVSSRQAAALAPLLGLNQMINAQYGNIGDIVGNAGNIYQAQLGAAQTRAQSAQQAYQQALAIDQFNREFAEKQRQFDISEARLRKSGGGGFDPSAILAAILNQNQQQSTQGQRPPLESFDISEETNTQRAPIQQQIPALPQAGFSFGLPSGSSGIKERLGAWKDLIIGGLTGR